MGYLLEPILAQINISSWNINVSKYLRSWQKPRINVPHQNIYVEWFKLAPRKKIASPAPDITIQLVPLFSQLLKEKQIHLILTWTAGAAIQTKVGRWRWGSYSHLVRKVRKIETVISVHNRSTCKSKRTTKGLHPAFKLTFLKSITET